ncbi:hypothetical protein EMIHUDRAFT_248726 [Emiliania huxleyi CCMP1516]|uniref:Uncharacterized protein n=2 Tax=Emiliania huxleyi TaxID=2903 RepID=A0A0D3IEJ8_EMIH1|nr:hypothetical protein EMIHUDRAFT_248726 [Emiliania huxleyi CCMP1516]EOD09683.1 hypothetical protein EMIHUDRAFT_248726 [Emiliania huxleyi CCMP1516]|eukprot:XP_005762112.1 hypothetical protein EMIHUDRAFT_248726 [Emiliania huxleyi CCMP1516]
MVQSRAGVGVDSDSKPPPGHHQVWWNGDGDAEVADKGLEHPAYRHTIRDHHAVNASPFWRVHAAHVHVGAGFAVWQTSHSSSSPRFSNVHEAQDQGGSGRAASHASHERRSSAFSSVHESQDQTMGQLPSPSDATNA